MKGRDWRCCCCDCSGSIETEDSGDQYIKARPPHGLCDRCHAFIKGIKGAVPKVNEQALRVALKEIEGLKKEFEYWSSTARELLGAKVDPAADPERKRERGGPS